MRSSWATPNPNSTGRPQPRREPDRSGKGLRGSRIPCACPALLTSSLPVTLHNTSTRSAFIVCEQLARVVAKGSLTHKAAAMTAKHFLALRRRCLRKGLGRLFRQKLSHNISSGIQYVFGSLTRVLYYVLVYRSHEFAVPTIDQEQEFTSTFPKNHRSHKRSRGLDKHVILVLFCHNQLENLGTTPAQGIFPEWSCLNQDLRPLCRVKDYVLVYCLCHKKGAVCGTFTQKLCGLLAARFVE